MITDKIVWYVDGREVTEEVFNDAFLEEHLEYGSAVVRSTYNIEDDTISMVLYNYADVHKALNGPEPQMLVTPKSRTN